MNITRQDAAKLRYLNSISYKFIWRSCERRNQLPDCSVLISTIIDFLSIAHSSYRRERRFDGPLPTNRLFFTLYWTFQDWRFLNCFIYFFNEEMQQSPILEFPISFTRSLDSSKTTPRRSPSGSRIGAFGMS